jgi:GMP synthase (glutamine-hydrolysing)
MKVMFLQHEASLGPGKLNEYLIRRYQTATTTLTEYRLRKDDEDLASLDLVVSLGSPVSVYRTDLDWVKREYRMLSRAIARGTPVLGICFGAQLIAALIGGSVTAIGEPHVGWMENDSAVTPLWRGPWFRFHKEQCHVPPSVEVLARSRLTIQAFQYENAIGLQFHPEMDAAMVEDLAPSMRNDFGMSAADINSVVEETRSKVETISASRDTLFAEIFGRFT